MGPVGKTRKFYFKIRGINRRNLKGSRMRRIRLTTRSACLIDTQESAVVLHSVGGAPNTRHDCR